MRVGSGEESSERGQILIVIATALFFVMLAATAVAVDLGNGLLQKRRLQNVSDAAALAATYELSRGSSQNVAQAAAEGVVSSNLGTAFTFPVSNTGSGTALTEGIEFGTNSVRVALKRSVQTMFAPVLGVNSLTAGARSKAQVGRSGVLPISVKRFSAGDTSYPLDSAGQADPVYDYLKPRNVDTIIGSPRAWPSPLTSSPSPEAGYSPPDGYDPALSGRVMPILGHEAQANMANGNDFHFWVIPDVRNITQSTPDYYNGVSGATSVLQLKDISSSYLWPLPGYPGPHPVVGEQIAVLNGVDTKKAVDALKKSYRRGDVVTAMVYDGTVYRRPSFSLQVDNGKKSTSSLVSSPVNFTLSVMPNNNFSSSGVRFWATGLSGWADWQFGPGSLNQPYDLPVPVSGATVGFQISSTIERTGARTGLIMAYDQTTGTASSIAVTVVVGSEAGFSVSCGDAYKEAEQGSPAEYTLQLKAENGYPHTDVYTNVLEWYSFNPLDPVNPTSLAGPPAGMSVSISANDNPAAVNNNAQVKVVVLTDSGTPTGIYMARLQMWDGTPAHTQEVYLVVEVVAAGTGTSLSSGTSFVNVLGYANFAITYADNHTTPSSEDNNTVYGYAVSGLAADPSALRMGLNPRLVGWSQ